MLEGESVGAKDLRDWHALPKEEQTRLLIEYGHHLDSLQPSCDLETKRQRFKSWLNQRGINYTL